MSITVLRLGHRPHRDKRASTHLMLAARAFGADNVFYSGIKDSRIEESIKKVCKEWGGEFSVTYIENWEKLIKEWEGKIIHLTMYGLELSKLINEIRADKNSKLVIVGGAKVPRNLYELTDWNVSITSQPHSEVSALAIFLHELFQGRELSSNFNNFRLKITPSANGKVFEVFSKD